MTPDSKTLDNTVRFIREVFNQPQSFIPLHEPRFAGNEKIYLADCIDSTFVSSVGKYVDDFEKSICQYLGVKRAVATVNGTAALHMALHISGVQPGDLVVTQPFSFVATCNAITYLQAEPLFVDIAKDTIGLCPEKLADFFESKTELRNDGCYHIASNKRIGACTPMHTFGHPVRIEEVALLCTQYQVPLVEDAAESIGSAFRDKMTGAFGKVAAFSFNGNKTITCGGGGVLVTDDEELADKAKHLTTQAKVPHAWDYEHDHIGYNYRMPNINAALACAQLEKLQDFLDNKRELANLYEDFFADSEFEFLKEPAHCRSNYWLNALILNSREDRDRFLEVTNSRGVMTRPAWKLMNNLRMFAHCNSENLDNAQFMEARIVNIPSSVRVS